MCCWARGEGWPGGTAGWKNGWANRGLRRGQQRLQRLLGKARLGERATEGPRIGVLAVDRQLQLGVPIWYIKIQICNQPWGPRAYRTYLVTCPLAILALRSHLSSLRLNLTIAAPPYLQLSSWSYHLLSLHPQIFCPLGSYLAIWTNCSLHSTISIISYKWKIDDGRDCWCNCIWWVKTLSLLQRMELTGSLQLHLWVISQCSGTNTDVPIFAFLS